MRYYKLKEEEQRQVKNLTKEVFLLANELGSKCLTGAFESGNIHNYEANEYDEYDEIFQYFIVSDWLGERMKETGYVIMEAEGLSFWCRLGCGYEIECDFVSLWEDINKKLNK